MAEPEVESKLLSDLMPILDLLASAGYVDARNADLSASDKLAGGLEWCISAVKATGHHSDVVIDETLGPEDKIKIGKGIGEALRSIGCPHPLQASQIQDLDSEAVYPVVQWIVNRIETLQDDSKDEVTYTGYSIQEEEHTFRQLVEELNNAENSLKILNTNMNDQNQRKVDVLNEMQHLRERLDKEGAKAMVPRLVSLLELLKSLERQESNFQSHCNAKHSELQAEVIELEERIASGNDSKNLSNFDHSLCDSLEKLNSAKRELASRLRAILLLKRQLDDVPSQSELIQYERRFSELYVHIQEKLRQTRKCYATYNALLEIKELMLKETSLLNSISSQFQDAITSTAGRMKLIDSMEGIVKGTQQKLEKVQFGLQAEQKVCDALKERYAAAIAEQRRCYSLLKTFQVISVITMFLILYYDGNK
ncbi:hypothetical protein L1049_018737 [Liquidambar formosana]|uniref:Coiled-coil domain-containing protein 93 n=1 Tax=Liquidambar formosana TaxID=63359 RepID=A0AAP0WNS8_LIQFO